MIFTAQTETKTKNNDVILTTFFSLIAPELEILTIPNRVYDESVENMTFLFESLSGDIKVQKIKKIHP